MKFGTVRSRPARDRSALNQVAAYRERRAQAGRPRKGILMSADPIALARDLIRCRSVTPAEGGALALIEKVLKGAGFEVHRVTFAEPGTDPIDNLYARIGTTAPHLMLAGHTDVVPTGDATKWPHPPFAA